MNRILSAAILATAGFTAVAAAQTAPTSNDNPDRIVTRDEALAQADRRFDRMDANRDGKIDAAEMTAMRPPAPGPAAMPPADGPAPAPRGGRLMARLDTNGDGAIDRTEFRVQAERRFDRMDANKDGKIDADERQAARDAMGMRRGGAGGDMPPPPVPPVSGAPQPDAGQ